MLTGQGAPGSALFLIFPMLELQTCPTTIFILFLWGFWGQFPMLANKYFTPWTISPVFIVTFSSRNLDSPPQTEALVLDRTISMIKSSWSPSIPVNQTNQLVSQLSQNVDALVKAPLSLWQHRPEKFWAEFMGTSWGNVWVLTGVEGWEEQRSTL